MPQAKPKPAPAKTVDADEQAAAAGGLDLVQIRAALNETKDPLHAKIAWVQQHVGQVEKTGQVAFNKTSFRHMQEHGLIGVLRPLWRAVGLSVVPGMTDPGHYTKNGNSAIVSVALTVSDVDGHDSITRWFVNEGIDNADKAFNKAYTGAVKYALQKFFLVPTEGIDDNETLDIENTRTATPPAAVQAAAANRATPEQISALRDTIVQSSLENVEVGNYLTAAFAVSTMDNLTSAQFGEFSKWVAAKIASTS